MHERIFISHETARLLLHLLPPGSSGHDNVGNGHDNDKRARHRCTLVYYLIERVAVASIDAILLLMLWSSSSSRDVTVSLEGFPSGSAYVDANFINHQSIEFAFVIIAFSTSDSSFSAVSKRNLTTKIHYDFSTFLEFYTIIVLTFSYNNFYTFSFVEVRYFLSNDRENEHVPKSFSISPTFLPVSLSNFK